MSFAAGRIGRGERFPPQFGQTSLSFVSTHSRQKVHSYVQIIASVAEGGRPYRSIRNPGAIRASLVQPRAVAFFEILVVFFFGLATELIRTNLSVCRERRALNELLRIPEIGANECFAAMKECFVDRDDPHGARRFSAGCIGFTQRRIECNGRMAIHAQRFVDAGHEENHPDV